jgi:hypothetical protein
LIIIINITLAIVKNVSVMHTNLSTTTIGLSLPVTTIRPFHIIKADETIIPKLRT